MLKVRFGKGFNEKYHNLLLSHPELAEIVPSKIKLFENNPQDTRLDNHALRKSMEGKWAFSITDDIRIIYEWTGANTVRFLAIGTHPEY